MKKTVLPLTVALLTAALTACGGGGDTTAPQVSLNALNTTVSTAGSVILSASATDDIGLKQVDFYVDGTLVGSDTTADVSGNYDISYTWEASKNGTHTVKAIATDTSGNKSAPAEKTVTVNIDTIKPVVTITSTPTSPITTTGVSAVGVQATDNTGIKQVDFYLDGTLVSTVTTPNSGGQYVSAFPWGPSQNGTHTIRVIATDLSGNTSVPVETTVTVNIDNVKPVVTISGIPAVITTAGTYTVSGTATDNVAVKSVHAVLTKVGASAPVLDQTFEQTSLTLNVPIDATLNGTYTLTVIATDTAGNVSDPVSVTFTVNIPTSNPNPNPTPAPDTTPPSVTITVPPSPITTPGNYSVTVSASDNVGVTSLTGLLTLPNGVQYPMTFTLSGGTQTIFVTNAYNGTSTLKVTAMDAAGNQTVQTAQVTVAIP